MVSNSIRPLEALTQPDSRSGILAASVERYHANIAALELGPGVPDEIRKHFDVARNLLLYSWFVYDFIPAAELHAYSSVEFALRLRMTTQSPDRKPPSLGRLLARALQQGWITGQGFEQYRRIEERRSHSAKLWADVPGYSPSRPTRTDPQEYARVILEGIPYFRNLFAHGSSAISPHGYLTLELCRDLINQIYGQPPPPHIESATPGRAAT